MCLYKGFSTISNGSKLILKGTQGSESLCPIATCWVTCELPPPGGATSCLLLRSICGSFPKAAVANLSDLTNHQWSADHQLRPLLQRFPYAADPQNPLGSGIPYDCVIQTTYGGNFPRGQNGHAFTFLKAVDTRVRVRWPPILFHDRFLLSPQVG